LWPALLEISSTSLLSSRIFLSTSSQECHLRIVCEPSLG